MGKLRKRGRRRARSTAAVLHRTLMKWPNQIRVIDSHTAGEPTRVIIEGGPDLGGGSLAERRELFSRQFDAIRTAVLCEPRGSDVLVGALLVPPLDRDCIAGVIFFNNVGY